MSLPFSGTVLDPAAGMSCGPSMEAELRRALDAGLFRIHWQPIVGCTTGELRGFEALLRWDRPGHGAVPPGESIAAAERPGLHHKLDHWILQQACGAAARWLRHLRAAVNVSACWFGRPGLTATVAAALEESGIDPGRLELDVSETVILANRGGLAAELDHVRSLGGPPLA